MAEAEAARPVEQNPGLAEQSAPPIDVQQLAERVYRLLVQEARLGRARGERVSPARR